MSISNARGIDEARVLADAGFGLTHVTYQLVDIPGMDGKVGVFNWLTPEGRRGLVDMGFHRIEVPAADGGIVEYYMDDTAHELYIQNKAVSDSFEREGDNIRIAQMIKQKILADRARSAIGDHMLFAPNNDNVHFDAKEIVERSGITRDDVQNARAMLRDTHFIAHTLPGTGREIWMTQMGWDAYLRMGGEIYTEE